MIPGVETLHARSVWEPVGYRMADDFTRIPTLYVPRNVTRGVAHYTGAMNVPSGDPGEDPHSIAGFLARATIDYLTNRTGGGYKRKSDGVFFPGYPLGYSFGVDWLGGVWTIRGFDFLPAATNQHNDYTVAVLMFVDSADKAPPLMWQSTRAIVREARRRSGRVDFNPLGTDHGTVRIETGTGTATACAGAGIRSQLITEFNIDKDEPMAVSYFKLAGVNPLTVWATSDGLIAVRLEEGEVNARGVDPFNLPVLPETEAVKFRYVFGAPRASVK